MTISIVRFPLGNYRLRDCAGDSDLHGPLAAIDGEDLHTYAMVSTGLAIIYLLARITKAVPSPLVSVLLLSAISIWLDLPVQTVSDMGALPEGMPSSALPDVPLTLETLRIIAPYSAAMQRLVCRNPC